MTTLLELNLIAESGGVPGAGYEIIYYAERGTHFFIYYGLPGIFVLALLGVIALIVNGRKHRKMLEQFGIQPKVDD